MTYQSLYRRYRPRRFGELRGQPHVVKALRNAVRDDRVGHAYLFSGPRGTGKTSTARILAKVLNCERPVDGEPCCVCPSCVSVEAGTSFDVHELDAASNNGVDHIRDLIEKANLATPGRTKVYILDEVHMLSKPAEGALLKTLEEPPTHVVFVLATTDPQKVTNTVRSRCQPLEFHLLPADELEQHVRWVIADAGLVVDDAAIEAVLIQGKGSARDTLSALDQVVAAGGVAPELEPLDELVEALIEADTARALTAVATAVQSGRDVRTLAEHLIGQLRDAFLSLFAPDLVQLPDRTRAVVGDQARRLGPAATVRAMEVLGEMLVELRHAPDPRLLLDVVLVRLTNPRADSSPAAVLARLERVERALGEGTPKSRSIPDSDHESMAAATTPPPRKPPTTERRRQAATAGAPATDEVAKAPPAVDTSQSVLAEGPATTTAPSAVVGARATLGGRARREDPAGGDARPAHDNPPVAATPTEKTPGEANGDAPAERPETRVPTSVVTSASSPGGGPTRDEIVLVWADDVVPKLRPLARALYTAGRWVDADDGVPVLALPNEHHRRKAEEHRSEAEAALAKQFGRPVALRLVLEVGQAAMATDAGQDEPIDFGELTDVPAPTASSVERVASAFPGAELIDET